MISVAPSRTFAGNRSERKTWLGPLNLQREQGPLFSLPVSCRSEPLGPGVRLAHEFPLLSIPVPTRTRIVVNPRRYVNPNLPTLGRLTNAGSDGRGAILGPDNMNTEHQSDKKYRYESNGIMDDPLAASDRVAGCCECKNLRCFTKREIGRKGWRFSRRNYRARLKRLRTPSIL
jgi:hypothetical protein